MKINNIDFEDFIFSDRKEQQDSNISLHDEYLLELNQESRKGKVNHKFQRKAKKNYSCEKCGSEIHKNEFYFEWKPLPTKKHWFNWRKRCIDCEPRHYNEVMIYENQHANNLQINIRNDYLKAI